MCITYKCMFQCIFMNIMTLSFGPSSLLYALSCTVLIHRTTIHFLSLHLTLLYLYFSAYSHIRQVIIRHGQWGDDFNITGGRGNGLFIESHSDIRGLNTGDQILQVRTFQYYFVNN